MTVPFETQTEMIHGTFHALMAAKQMGQVDEYFYQVSAALNALLRNLVGKRAADWPGMGDDNRDIMASVHSSIGRPLIGIDPGEVTLDMTKGKRGRIVDVDVDASARERESGND